MSRLVQLEPGWRKFLEPVLRSPPLLELRESLAIALREGQAIYPPPNQWFAALNATAFADVRVVILGQDPYHGPGQAHGLAFSVPPGVAVPPSLANIHAELARDVGVPKPAHGSLAAWAERGVLLLNTVLTVAGGAPGSHRDRGWEAVTDAAIDALSGQRESLVFMLWGRHAARKASRIDRDRHAILRAPHPSPLSAHRGFIGCGHFSAANRFFGGRGLAPIDWTLPPLA